MTALPLIRDDEWSRLHVAFEEAGCGCLRTDRGLLPLVAMDVDAKVIASYAHTTLRQVFVNTLGVPIEATYIFPLPDRAAVHRFVMEVNGRKVEGELQERMAARRTYDHAIAQGKRASIAEEERAGVFTIRVGNLMPGEHAAITLELSGALPIADGEVTYRFPLVVAPRYMPGASLGGDHVGDGVAADTDAVPDASRISPPVLLPGFPNPVRLSIGVELDPAGLPLSEVRSSLHAAYADERAGRLAVRTTAGERLDRDFVLRFRLGDAGEHTTARLAQDGSGEATLALTVLPPTLNVGGRPKDVVFVLDRSGSMDGWKMVAARRATSRMIDALRPADRFQVIAFDDRLEEIPFGNGMLIEAGDRRRFMATEWLGKVSSRGGTEMAPALSRAADLLGGGYLERDRVLVFVTDGQVGNEAQLMKLLGQRLRGARVFALGIDQAVNAAFLNRLAQLGRSGDAELVESEDRLDDVLSRLHRRVDTPAISELSIDVQGASLIHGTVAPGQLPDVFAGVPATIFARVRAGYGGGSVGGTVIVRGRRADGGRFEERVPLVPTHNPALPAAWARLHLRDLEDRFDAGKGDRGGLERQIVEVSLRHHVLCRFTAFVAVDHQTVNPGGWGTKVTQAVDQPAGWGGAAAKPAVSSSKYYVAQRVRAAPMSPAPAGRARMESSSVDAKDADASFLDSAMEPTEALSARGARSLEELDDEGPADLAAPEPAAAPPPARPAASYGFAKATSAIPEQKREQQEVLRSANRPMAPGADLAKKAAGFLGGLLGGKGDQAKTRGTATLQDFLPRLVELLEWLRASRLPASHLAAELDARLRVLLEEMAHAGVTPTERHPLGEARLALADALTRHYDVAGLDRAVGDVVTLLEDKTGRAPATPRREGFWR
ncbi:MAG: VWA domain-containing protein [Deltaproteobacteria bacterium]|nr:VWA domain-containing protein [Deltaproteobacteria bacterium]